MARRREPAGAAPIAPGRCRPTPALAQGRVEWNSRWIVLPWGMINEAQTSQVGSVQGTLVALQELVDNVCEWRQVIWRRGDAEVRPERCPLRDAEQVLRNAVEKLCQTDVSRGVRMLGASPVGLTDSVLEYANLYSQWGGRTPAHPTDEDSLDADRVIGSELSMRLSDLAYRSGRFPGSPATESDASTGIPGEPPEERSEWPPYLIRAGQQYHRARAACGADASDQALHEWLVEDSRGEGVAVPAMLTWCKYARDVRRRLGQPRNSPRAGRQSGAVVHQYQI